MLDEDVVLKFARYTNERILIINAFLIAILPAIFGGGSSMLAMCIIFSVGIIAPINVISYPRMWIDAPEYVRLKYFAAITPALALLALTLYRISIPAISDMYIEGESFDYLSNSEQLSLAFTDTLAAVGGAISILSMIAVGTSIYFITQSRFIVQSLVSICSAGVVIMALCGLIAKGFDYMDVPPILGIFGPESFASFENGQDWASFAFLWSSALFAVTIYTPQRFRIRNMVQSARTLILALASLLGLSAFFTASPILKILVALQFAVVFAVYAFNVFPIEKILKIHWKSARKSHMPKRPLKEVICPFAIYLVLSLASLFAAANAYMEYGIFEKTAEELELAAEWRNIDEDALEIAQERPLWGWGANSFSAVFALNQGDDIDMRKIDTPSSDFLRARVEYGFLGMGLIFLMPLLLWLRVLVKNGFSQSGIIFLSSIILISVYASLSTPFVNPCVFASFWIVFFCYLTWEKAEII